MKFEKVNNDKIKITISSADLEANDIDFHSFMLRIIQKQIIYCQFDIKKQALLRMPACCSVYNLILL